MAVTEEKMLVLDSPLLGKKKKKISWKTDLQYGNPVDVGIVLMTRCLVLFPEMCLSLGLSW